MRPLKSYSSTMREASCHLEMHAKSAIVLLWIEWNSNWFSLIFKWSEIFFFVINAKDKLGKEFTDSNNIWV